MHSVIRVGPLAVALRSEGADWSAALAARYGVFALAGATAVDFELRLLERSAPPDGDEIAALHSEEIHFEAHGGRWEFRSSSLRGVLDFDRRRGEVSGPLHRHAVDIALRLLLASELVGGLLLHGALLGSPAGAWLCAGPSGAGKTTLGRLFPEAALCDELAFLRRESGGWTAFATPFWQGRPFAAPLLGVRWIRHGECDRLTRLRGPEAWRRVAPEVRWPPGDAAAPALARLAQLLAEVEVAELAFRPTPEVWKVLEGRAA